MGKNPDPGSGIRNKHPVSYFHEHCNNLNSLLRARSFYNPRTGNRNGKIWIRDKHQGSATSNKCKIRYGHKLTHLREMKVHFVTVKVRIVGRAHALIEPAQE